MYTSLIPSSNNGLLLPPDDTPGLGLEHQVLRDNEVWISVDI